MYIIHFVQQIHNSTIYENIIQEEDVLHTISAYLSTKHHVRGFSF